MVPVASHGLFSPAAGFREKPLARREPREHKAPKEAGAGLRRRLDRAERKTVEPPLQNRRPGSTSLEFKRRNILTDRERVPGLYLDAQTPPLVKGLARPGRDMGSSSVLLDAALRQSPQMATRASMS
ncbi:hypothetical protein KM043_006973 [Ampulex compressa]|nr:hypothetical protein KM043_006973 [Ampulex compressa]